MLAASVPAFDRAARDRVDRLERLLAAGRTLTSELDLESVLGRILETARELTGAEYGALGVLDERRGGLEHFLTAGLAEEDPEEIGDPPRKQGILELLIGRAEPIRLRGVLGAPTTIRARTWGGLYLIAKQDAEDFDDDDVATIDLLAEWAAVAIDNARLLKETTTRRDDLDRALRTMRTAMEIATAIGGDTDLAHILELIVQRARTLVDADGLLIWLRHGDQLRIAAVAGHADVPDHASIPLGASTAGQALRAGRSVRIEDAQQMLINPAEFGMAQATSSLIVPLVHRGRGLGVLVAFDSRGATASFDADNELALEAFAASAATAVATARLVEAQRLHDSIAAAESERGRWARELHDETLQGLASLKLSLAGTLKANPDRTRSVIKSAVTQLERDIVALRAIITDLRPAALDELGLEPALRTLVAGVAQAGGLLARVSIKLGAVRLDPDVETIAYRVAQEALTNVVKHADARTVTVELILDAERLRLIVADDGRGFGEVHDAGYGIAGMRERAALASGVVEIAQAADGGTRVALELPLG
jgi:two-component system, NarL family, sensor histidine kinase DevS